MKVRITVIFATAVLALTAVAAASASASWSGIKPGGAKTWNVRGWDYNGRGPSASAGWRLKPNPTSARGAVKGW